MTTIPGAKLALDPADIVIDWCGDHWRVDGTGVRRGDKLVCHLRSVTRGRQQKNGWSPAGIIEEVPLERLEQAGYRPAYRLNVPFSEKTEAKRLGAQWDGSERCWMVPDNIRAPNVSDISVFERWCPTPYFRAAESGEDAGHERSCVAAPRR